MLPRMFLLTEADAAAIRAIYEQEGELSAAIELRRRFPGITDNAKARACVRSIARLGAVTVDAGEGDPAASRQQVGLEGRAYMSEPSARGLAPCGLGGRPRRFEPVMALFGITRDVKSSSCRPPPAASMLPTCSSSPRRGCSKARRGLLTCELSPNPVDNSARNLSRAIRSGVDSRAGTTCLIYTQP
jgi:hypothetical protein